MGTGRAGRGHGEGTHFWMVACSVATLAWQRSSVRRVMFTPMESMHTLSAGTGHLVSRGTQQLGWAGDLGEGLNPRWEGGRDFDSPDRDQAGQTPHQQSERIGQFCRWGQ